MLSSPYLIKDLFIGIEQFKAQYLINTSNIENY